MSIYITFENYKWNFGYNATEKGILETISTNRFNSIHWLLAGFLDSSSTTGVTDTELIRNPTNAATTNLISIWDSDEYKKLPTAGMGSLIFTNYLNFASQLTTAGYLVVSNSQDKTTYISGKVTEKMVEAYGAIDSPSKAVNSTILQQDPNQIILNDKTSDNVVMKNYTQLYILSYFFKTKKLPRLVT